MDAVEFAHWKASNQVEPIGREVELLGLLTYITAVVGQVKPRGGGEWSLYDFWPAERPPSAGQTLEEATAILQTFFGLARRIARKQEPAPAKGQSHGDARKPGRRRPR